jgi:hypothetical protein
MQRGDEEARRREGSSDRGELGPQNEGESSSAKVEHGVEMALAAVAS